MSRSKRDPEDDDAIEQAPTKPVKERVGARGGRAALDAVNANMGAGPGDPGEITDAIQELAKAHPDRAMVHVDRFDEDGLCHAMFSRLARDFDVYQFAREKGAGKYRITLRVRGEGGNKFNRLLFVDSPTPPPPFTAPPAAAAPPAPTPPSTPPAYSSDPSGAMMMQNMAMLMSAFQQIQQANTMAQQQQQTLLLEMMRTQLDGAKRTPIHDLIEMHKVVKMFSGGRRDDEESSVLDKMIGAAIPAFFQNAQQSPVPTGDGAQPAASESPAPQAPSTPPAAPQTKPAPPAQPAAPATENPIVRFVALLQSTAKVADRDPGTYANNLRDFVNNDALISSKLMSVPAGQFVTDFLKSFPELAAQEDFVRLIEQELRESLLESEPAEQAKEQP